MGEIGQLAAQLGLAGACVATMLWLVFHLVTKTLPEMTATFRAEVSAMRRDEALALDLKRREFLEALTAERKDFREMLLAQQTMFSATLDRLERRSETQHQAIMSELQRIANGRPE